MYTLAFFLVASLLTRALGALPRSGGTFLILNLQTEFVWDDAFAKPDNENPILAQTVNNPPTGNQHWTLTQVGTAGTSGIYAIRCVSPNIFAYAGAQPGAGIVAQSTLSAWSITEFRGSGLYTISAPSVNLTVTSRTAATQQMTLQPFQPNSPLKTQLWAFVPL